MPEGPAADPEEALQKGARHGPHLGCAHERHELRRVCCTWHPSPSSAAAAFVEDGDTIELDIPARRLNLLGERRRADKRRRNWRRPELRYARGYGAIFTQNVTHERSCVLANRSPVAEPDIFRPRNPWTRPSAYRLALTGAAATKGATPTVKGIDPSTGKELEPAYGSANAADLDRACAPAAAHTYRATSQEARAKFLEKTRTTSSRSAMRSSCAMQESGSRARSKASAAVR
jgi:hypothetical protein